MVDIPKTSGVVFNEERDATLIEIPRPEPRSFTYRLMHLGIAASAADAAILMALAAAVLIAINIYLFAQSVPSTPMLGSDHLRGGELPPPMEISPTK